LRRPAPGSHAGPFAGILPAMGKENRLGKMAARAEQKAARSGESATEIAESFRKANKALEAAARDFVALRHKLTKPTSR
jgi:hypothetical protein